MITTVTATVTKNNNNNNNNNNNKDVTKFGTFFKLSTLKLTLHLKVWLGF